jgi:MFS family permease
MPYTVLMPVYADRVLKGGPSVVGFLLGASGLGALVGALYLASRKSVVGLGRMIPEAAAIFGVGLIGFGLSRNFWLSMILIFLAGFGMMVELAASNTLLQTIVDDDKRGRIMSFYVVAFAGVTPFGSLFAGSFGNWWGSANTLVMSGLICLAGALFFLSQLAELRKLIRPIYLRKGIIRQAVVGVETASRLGD